MHLGRRQSNNRLTLEKNIQNICILSKILPDDPGNQPNCHIPFFINMRYYEGYFIFLSYCPVIIAGVGNGIDSDGEPDKYRPLVDIFHSSGIFSLYFAFLYVFLAGIAFHTLRMEVSTPKISARTTFSATATILACTIRSS